jgi:hypothetical protein
MRFITLTEDEDIAKLSQRLSPQASETERKAIEKRLREANPQLQGRKQAAGGSVLVVPEGAGTAAAAGQVRDAQALAASVLQQVQAMVDGLGGLLENEVKRREAGARAVAKQLASSEVASLGRKDVALKAQLATAGKAAKADLAQAKSARAVNKQGIADLRRDLETLRQRLGGRPGSTS